MQSGAIRLARAALATPDLRRLQLANVATGVGGWAFMVSLAVHAYAVGGAAAVGLAALVRMAAAGLGAPPRGLRRLLRSPAPPHNPAQAALPPSLAPSTPRQAASNALWTAIDNG